MQKSNVDFYVFKKTRK